MKKVIYLIVIIVNMISKQKSKLNNIKIILNYDKNKKKWYLKLLKKSKSNYFIFKLF